MKFIIPLLLLSITACTAQKQNNLSSPGLTPPAAKAEPYQLDLRIEQVEKESAVLILDLKICDTCYFVSPSEKRQFSGRLNVSVDATDKIRVNKTFIEIQTSEKTRIKPTNLPEWFTRENTTYKQEFSIIEQGDFEVDGLITFVIEPRCTLEKIPFRISQKSGHISVVRKC